MTCSGVCVAQSIELPKYCENFPAIGGDLDEFKDKLIEKKSKDIAYTLCSEDQKIPVEVMDIMNYWASIQKVENNERVDQFEEKLRKKVFAAVASSVYPYENLYQKSCQGLSNYRGRDYTGARSQCEKDQDFIPKCNNSEYQEILESKESDHHEFREKKAREALVKEGAQDFSSEQVEQEALNEAHDHLDEQKKLSFMKSQLQNSVLIDKLLKQREEEFARYEREGARDVSIDIGDCIGRGCVQRRKKLKAERQSQLERNHELELRKINGALGKIYQKSPALFELEKDFNFSIKNLVSTRYEKSDFAEKLKDKALRQSPELAQMSLEETQKLITSLDGQSSFAQMAASIVEADDSSLKELGQEKVFEEKRKKKEALEKLCQGKTEGLHHFSGIAESVVAESMQNADQGNKELVEDQAAYCYLLQTRPIGEEGGLGLGPILGASALFVGGVVVQVIPGFGQVAGAGAFGTAAAFLGGGVFAYDSFDRYATSKSQYESTQAAYHGSTAWADSVNLIESRDKMLTDTTLAIVETGLIAVDGVLMIKPMTTLAMRLKRAGIEASSKTEKVSSTGLSQIDSVSAAKKITRPKEGQSLQLTANETRVSTKKANKTIQQSKSSNIPATTKADGQKLLIEQKSSVKRLRSTEEDLKLFRAQDLDKREEIAAAVLQKVKSGSVEEGPFLNLVMQRAKYGKAFTPGVQNMARELLSSVGKGREESMGVIKRFFEGKKSSGSQRKQKDLERLVDEIYEGDVQKVITYDKKSLFEKNLPARTGGQRGRNIEKDLANFRAQDPKKQKEIAAYIMKQVKGGSVEEGPFLALVMQRAKYGKAFTPGVQDMARKLMSSVGRGREESMRIIRRFYEGKNSPGSQRKKKDLERLVDEIYASGLEDQRSLALTRGTGSGEIIPTAPSRNMPANTSQVNEVPRGTSIAKNLPQEKLEYAPSRFLFERPLSTRLPHIGLGTMAVATHKIFNEQNQNASYEGRDSRDVDGGDDNGNGNGNDDSVSSADASDGPVVKIRVIGEEFEGQSEKSVVEIRVEGEKANFKVEAYMEDDNDDVPPGVFNWKCLPSKNQEDDSICEDSDFSETGDSQDVKTFDRVSYVLEATYIVEEGHYEGNHVSVSRTFKIEKKCETNEDGTQCISDSEEDKTEDSDEEEENSERVPFWWESLPPNASPPDFRPGPPFQMRTFILPGSI